MSPVVFREAGFSFFFFSREERRMHIHVRCAEGEARFWLEPTISLAQNAGLARRQLRKAQVLIEARADEIRCVWKKHFGS